MLVETQRIMRDVLSQIGTESLEAKQVEISELQGGLQAISRVIVRHAKRSGADLIVMGTNARTGVLKWLIGSVAEAVIYHSEVPVMLVRKLEVRAKDSERMANAVGIPNLEPNV